MRWGWLCLSRNSARQWVGATDGRQVAGGRLLCVVCFAFAIGGQIALAAGSACPVSIQKVKRDTGIGDRNTYCFSLQADNQSSKDIAVVHISAVAIDSKPWEHPLRYDYTISDLGQGERKQAYFSTHRLLGTDYRGVKVWVESVEFGDKSIWKDTGDRACGAKDVKGK